MNGMVSARVKQYQANFWKYVRKTPGCWFWTGALSGPAPRFNYGKFWIGYQIRAHRFSYELAHGPIPKGVNVLHRCDTPPCVRPVHLFLGTVDDNHQDQKQKGRTLFGERSFTAKLTADQVIEIRRRYAAGQVSLRQLEREYQVSDSHIDRIVKRRKWACIPEGAEFGLTETP
mgnify:CR=1 FL=1